MRMLFENERPPASVAPPTIPFASVVRSLDVCPVIARLVEVAFVVVPFVTVSEEMVEEALTMRPRVVVGARYPFPWTERSRNWD